MDKLLGAAREAAQRVVGSLPPMALRAMLWTRASREHPSERGQGLAEYALILGLIAIVAIASLVFMGETISEMFWDPISEDFRNVLIQLGLTPPPPP